MVKIKPTLRYAYLMPPFQRTSLLKRIFASKITLLLIACNVAVYGVAGFLDSRAFESLSQTSFLIDWGGNVPALTLSGEYWRLFTSMFLHIGFLHLAINMLALWSLGIILEARMRSGVFLGVYLLSGLCGSLVTALWHRDEFFLSCGASGAILGIFGAAIVYGLHDRRMGRPHIPPGNLLFSLVLTFGAGFAFDVDNAAHLGGLLSGALLAGIALYAERLRPVTAAVVLAATGTLSAVALAAVTLDNHDRGMQEQLAAAQFGRTLGKMGLLGSDQALWKASSLDECIAGALSAAVRDGSRAPDLRGCAKPGDRDQALLARFMPLQYQSCHAQIAGLRKLYPDAALQEALTAADQYCGVQAQIYGAIFQADGAELDLEKARQARLKMNFLLDERGMYRTDSAPLRAQANAMKRMLRRPGELAWAIIGRSGCPYWSCER
ncbi:rhomboid family intramembrane serine protease [Achromobacter sp. ACM01]|uniref:rhomboid family intramembrane serine protease n=1 Tax=Achromobacter sp. ACM01 TaxID=2769298 RepID=UPI00177B3298|nr:rhomboid family intramembrane serine protease [Achromobacter sp. ACM01]MBD9476557.1 rhomboid family intramembrane serine protease [Achromobacter sp. ACM01]